MNPGKYRKKARASTGEIKMKDHIQASTEEYEVQEKESGQVPENGSNPGEYRKGRIRASPEKVWDSGEYRKRDHIRASTEKV